MRLTQLEPTPFHELRFRTAGKRGQIERRTLPFFRAFSETLEPKTGAIVITSDLQGREAGVDNRLLGEAVAEELQLLVQCDEIPEVGLILLAGDLYEYPDCHKRGGSGDVTAVWEAFAEIAGEVIGVHGNHDELPEPHRLPGHAQVLEGEMTRWGSLKVGGVSGIIGDPSRAQRKSETAFVRALDRLAQQKPDILLLHQGPDAPERGLRGDPMVRLALETGFRGLTVFGHTPWPAPFYVPLGDGVALNCDARVIVVCPAGTVLPVHP